MNILVRFGFATAFSALLMQTSAFSSKLIFWKDTVAHQTISLCVVFLVISVLIYFAISRYVDMYRRSKILIPVATILLWTVIAINVLNIDVLVALPKQIVTYADMWYALPGAIGVYFIALFFAKQ